MNSHENRKNTDVSVPLRGFINRKPGGGAGACGIYVSVPLRGFINRKP